GPFMGAPEYRAAERARGRGREGGAPADVYALCAVLYEVLTGRPPFKSANVWATLAQVLAVDPVPPRQLDPKVPRDLETICLKGLRKEPRQRYLSAAELADDLERFGGGRPRPPPPPSPPRRA